MSEQPRSAGGARRAIRGQPTPRPRGPWQTAGQCGACGSRNSRPTTALQADCTQPPGRPGPP
eukprot:700573-Lingulodinium_polyedra.AAC.1